MNNAVFEKNIENMRKHRDRKLTAVKKKDLLVSEQNYHTTKTFREKILAMRKMRKIEILLNKPVCDF